MKRNIAQGIISDHFPFSSVNDLSPMLAPMLSFAEHVHFNSLFFLFTDFLNPFLKIFLHIHITVHSNVLVLHRHIYILKKMIHETGRLLLGILFKLIIKINDR